MPFHSMGFTIVLSSYLFWPLPPPLSPPPPPPIPTSPPCHIQYDTVVEAEFWTLFSKTRPEAILPFHSMGFTIVLSSYLFWPLPHLSPSLIPPPPPPSQPPLHATSSMILLQKLSFGHYLAKLGQRQFCLVIQWGL